MANPLRKTMVYLGLADEELEYEQEVPAAPAPAREPAPVAQHQPAAAPARAAVTPLRRSAPARQTAHQEMNEILTVHPRAYKDAQVIAENFREGIPVIMNLSQMTESDQRRIVDFASGLSQGLYGRIERVTSKVFLLSPAHIAVSGETAQADDEVDASFFSAQ